MKKYSYKKRPVFVYNKEGEKTYKKLKAKKTKISDDINEIHIDKTEVRVLFGKGLWVWRNNRIPTNSDIMY